MSREKTIVILTICGSAMTGFLIAIICLARIIFISTAVDTKVIVSTDKTQVDPVTEKQNDIVAETKIVSTPTPKRTIVEEPDARDYAHPNIHDVYGGGSSVGPRGGVYHYSPSGKKVYSKKH